MKLKFGFLFSILICLQSVAVAQDGGVNSIFHQGVGARQSALGGAVVAYPQDPTTIYWNPAGLEYLPEKSISLYYTTFLGGTSYQFVGFAFPILYIGTFGAGVTRISTDGIIEQGSTFLQDGLGEFGSNQSEFYLSYAKIIRNLISVGLNIKLQHHSINDLSDTGIGGDLSFMYLPEFDNSLLRNIRLGLNVQNIVSPILNPGDASDKIPTRILFGFAKPFYLGFNRNPLVLLLSLDQNKQQNIGYHTGLEYTYLDKGMVRFGLDQNGFAFGAGTVYKRIQIDYAYGKLVESAFGDGHKLSFSINFGKSREEILQIAERKRELEIASQVELGLDQERQNTINRLLLEGRLIYNNATTILEYLDAIIKFSQVLDLDSTNAEADERLAESDKRVNELRQTDVQEQLSAMEDERLQEEAMIAQARIDSLTNLGQSLFNSGEYDAAIDQWDKVLVERPDDQFVKDMIASAQAELTKNVDNLIQRADNMARNRDYAGAITILYNAQLLSVGDDEALSQLSRRINRLERLLNVSSYYQSGLVAYTEEKWAEALNDFTKARQIDHNYMNLNYYYTEADRRVKAKNMAMTPDMETKFRQGYNLYLEGSLQEAIDIWEELLLIQHYNKQIVETIDNARKQLEKQNNINR